ncbi:uncharacterized protein F5Z01DRAFT_247036 [Emericellopsis atlantica]|uniref:Uncharacterized protein n=1 Tax=Emericellopsis atlantica TaxID=2614577 RepID=A0A9P8CM37_9HYPO|nr:uncharacterized protein F5Z01DRAFT_247036 [Emericellopsis atlantica]KAG9252058.1 hypothetical protein F5Z01DRAFT_247036 [Emericellopsis atlantica]
MTRLLVYSAALVGFLASTSMIIASIILPQWVSYTITTSAGETLTKTIGLHKSCSSLADPPCRPFPYHDLCQSGERYFCSMWRSVGFMATLSAILCLACLVAFTVVMSGGKYKRETGWPFVTVMLSLVAIVQFVVIAIVAYLYDHDDQFTVPGWHLDISWILSTVSATICALAAVGLAASAYMLPQEDGYDFLEDPLDS